MLDRPLLETYCLPSNLSLFSTGDSPILSTNLPTPLAEHTLTFSPASSSDYSLPSTPLLTGPSSTRKRKASAAFDDIIDPAPPSNYLGLEHVSPLSPEEGSFPGDSEVTGGAPNVIETHDDDGISIAEFAEFLQDIKRHPSRRFSCPLCPNPETSTGTTMLRHLYEGMKPNHFYRIAMAILEKRSFSERDIAIAICIAIVQEFQLGVLEKPRLALSKDEREAQAEFSAKTSSFTNDRTLATKDNRRLLIRFKRPLIKVAKDRQCGRCHRSFGRIYDHRVNKGDRCTRVKKS